MNIKTIKKHIGHENIIAEGYKLTKILKGFFKVDGVEIITPVLQYKKARYCENVDVGYYVKNYNRFGRIQ